MIRIYAFILLMWIMPAQDCPHPNNLDRFEHVRVTAPSRISFFDGKTVEYISEDGKEIRAGTVTLTPSTRLPKDFNYKEGLWFIVYCGEHGHAYDIQRYNKK